MGYQSAALAYNFGLNYEFGKRVIKSMSNEKFNEIANDPILLNELTSRHHDVLLKAFINEVPKVDKIQDLIIKKMVELEFAKIKVMPELIAQIPAGFLEGIFKLGETGKDDTGGSTGGGSKGKTGSGGKSGKGTGGEGTTTSIVLNQAYMIQNASGRVINVTIGKGIPRSSLQANHNGTWTVINNSTDTSALNKLARQSWPKFSNKDCTHSVLSCPGHNEYGFNVPGKRPLKYWLNRTKLQKTSHNL